MSRKRTFLLAFAAAAMLSLPLHAQNLIARKAVPTNVKTLNVAKSVDFASVPSENMLIKAMEAGEMSKAEFANLMNENIGKPVVRNSVRKAENVDVLPYINPIATEDAFNDLTIIDANNDASTWSFFSTEPCARYKYNKTNKGDDWLVTPGIKLVKDKKYVFSVDARQYGDMFPERLEVKMAKVNGEVTAASLSSGTVVIAETGFSGKEYVTLTNEITAPDDGYYVFGIHAVSEPDNFYLYAKNIKVEAGLPETAPASPTVEVTPADGGLLKATVKVTAPDKNLKGDALSGNLSKIVVMRDGSTIKTFNDVAPGAVNTFTDDQGITDGEHTYISVAYDAAGEAGKVSGEIKAYIGIDTPKAVDNFVCTDKQDKVGLTWNRVTEGKDGHYMDPARVSYILYTVKFETIWGMTFPVLDQKIDSLVDKTSYDYPFASLDEGDQGMKTFGMLTSTVAGVNNDTKYANILVGKPYELPFIENFATQSLTHYWYVNGITSILLSSNASDGDGSAMILALSKYAEQPGEGYFSSGKININPANKPYLIFDVKSASANANLSVWGSKNGGEFTKLSDITLSDTYTLNKIDLSSLKGGRYASVRFVSDFASVQDSLILDNIMVRDLYSDDLGVEISAPANVVAGENIAVNVKVINNGENNCNKYTVELYANNEKVDSKEITDPLNAFKEKEIVFNYPTTIFAEDGDINFKAKVLTETDLNPDNNEAETVVNLKHSSVSAPENFKGKEKDGGVTLTWEAPKNLNSEVTEDFEKYDKWIYDNVGDWTMIDQDKQYTGGFFRNTYYPHQQDQFAYIVWTPRDFTGDGTVNITEANPTMAPHSGEKALASIYSFSIKEDGSAGDFVANDDWLVSPELPGTAQTINFYTGFYASDDGQNVFPQTYQVLSSSTGKEVNDFTKIGEDRVTSTPWENVSVDLPEGAKYFAIRNISSKDNAFIFLVDDITYTAGNEVVSYNIYVDGELTTSVDGATLEAVLNGIGNGEHTYAVTAVYKGGIESKPVIITLTTTGISSVSADGKPVDIYTVDGKLVRKQATSLEGLNGLYIINGQKVIVK